MVRVMDEVASGTELAVLVLVVIATHLLPENWLVADQLLNAVCKKAIAAVVAVPRLGKTPAQLQFPLFGLLGSSFIIYRIDTHAQYFINYTRTL